MIESAIAKSKVNEIELADETAKLLNNSLR